MKNILGLDLGTNSIGWAVVGSVTDAAEKEILAGIKGCGSRIIPMDASQLSDFAKGNTVSQTADRRSKRTARRMNERFILRRERLHRVLNLMGFLPEHYAASLDRYGKFIDADDHKIAWRTNSDGRQEFVYRQAFNEMYEEFKSKNPEFLKNGGKIPYDWTIYYLRKKALYSPITKEELSWILLNANQKRGYNQLMGMDEQQEQEDRSKSVEYLSSTIVEVTDSGDKKGKATWWNCKLDNGMVYKRPSEVKPDWEGKTKEFIITTDLDKDGKPKLNKYGEIQRSFRMPGENDWTLIKTRTEDQVNKSGEFVGEYIFNALLKEPTQKIRGKLIRTIDREFYRSELKAILGKQVGFIKELTDRDLYRQCIEELYPSNDGYRNSIASRDFIYLLADDIILYQRPLKTKKSLIDNCPYESHIYTDKETGEVKTAPVKCIAKSQPLYQEFRLWQFVQNLRIYDNFSGEDETSFVIPTEAKRVEVFKYLNDISSTNQESFFKEFLGVKKPKGKDSKLPYVWNYVEGKDYPCNETRGPILSRLKKSGIPSSFLTRDIENDLWLILYSSESRKELEEALRKFAGKHDLAETFVENFKKFPAFEKDYGAYSAKAIKKLLPLMRMGEFWSETAISDDVKANIENIINGNVSASIPQKVRDQLSSYKSISDFKGLPLYLACYVVYGRHSEASDSQLWTSPEDIDAYLNNFKQHSLHNPIVEQVVTETLRTVRDIWRCFGKIDEIHIEMGRDLKSPADKRRQYQMRALENENTNMRIRALLMEFTNPDFKIDYVRPYSPSQQDLLRIYEETVLNSGEELPDYVVDVLRNLGNGKTEQPTHAEILKYKLWLDQKYRSPYTGQPIPLAKLFTPAYEIEHVIPQARYFDDSYNNKVICESEVNKLKSNMLGHEFIDKHGGEAVSLNMGGTVRILTKDKYEDLVKKIYGNERMRIKFKNLMLDDIPEDFINRQLNDSRYISRLMLGLLSNIVRKEGETEATSRNVIATNGSITDRLKVDWGIKDTWNKILLPRFRRMNEITGTNEYTTINRNGHEIPNVPDDMSKGFIIKRIDHRHHAMDAIVIACASRNIVNYLNNSSACKGAKISRYDLQHLLCNKVLQGDGNYSWVIKTPWTGFQNDVYNALNNIIVSFKQNLRVINKTTNYYQHYEEGKKIIAKQMKGDSWAVRKSMHRDTVFREVNLRMIRQENLKSAIEHLDYIVNRDLKEKLKEFLREGISLAKIKNYFEQEKDTWSEVNLKKIDVYYFTQEDKNPETGLPKHRFFSTRKPIDMSYTEEKIKTQITDTAIQKILLAHLAENGNDPKVAFSPDGIDRMNDNIVRLNNGRMHQPIFKVPYFEEGQKFSVGKVGAKAKKFVEADKGTNIFFAIYENEAEDEETGEIKKVRSFADIPLNVAIDREKQGLAPAPENGDGMKPIMVLSPGDLVYVPTEEEIKDGKLGPSLDKNRIYKMVSSGQGKCYFIPQSVASVIKDKVEFESGNKSQKTIDGKTSIKEVCYPVKVDRLGHIISINGDMI